MVVVEYKVGDRVRLKATSNQDASEPQHKRILAFSGTVGEIVRETGLSRNVDPYPYSVMFRGEHAWCSADELEPAPAEPSALEQAERRVGELEAALEGAHLLIMDITDTLSQGDEHANTRNTANALGKLLKYIREHNDEYELLTLQERVKAAAKALAGGAT